MKRFGTPAMAWNSTFAYTFGNTTLRRFGYGPHGAFRKVMRMFSDRCRLLVPKMTSDLPSQLIVRSSTRGVSDRSDPPVVSAERQRQQNVESEINKLIEEKVRPHAQSDGGDVIFRSMNHEHGVVHVTMKGACVGCSSSTVTLKFMVLRLLQHYFDEVSDVEGHDEVDDGIF